MISRQRVLVTGASGFVGRAVVEYLICSPKAYEVLGAGRATISPTAKTCRYISGLELGSESGWDVALEGVGVVVHCAARAHVMNDQTADPLAEFRRVNVDGTLRLARLAAGAGVKRFVFISSVKVQGEHTDNRPPFDEAEVLAPEDAYAISKAEAEQKLAGVCAETGMELIVIRPTLVYGPGVKGNFFSLLKLCNLPIPLPFGSMNNKRSMIYVGNLAHFIELCVSHPDAAGKKFLISDDEDLSLSELLAAIRRLMGRSAWLLPVPIGLFWLAATLIGKKAAIARLTGNLVVDSSKARNVLGWVPPYSILDGLSATADDFSRR